MKIPVYKTEGIIVGRVNANEFDRLLVVYTKEFGKILVKAKSLRKKEAKMKAQLELFNYVHLILAKGKNMDTISGVVLLDGFPRMRENLESLAAAFYIGELLDKLIVGPERDERIWQLVLKAFNFLDRSIPQCHSDPALDAGEEFHRGRPSRSFVPLRRAQDDNKRKAQIKELARRFEYNLLALLGHQQEKEKKSYLEIIQSLTGEKIESQMFLSQVLAWG
jgi:recombinational DNA repair protein (RecF pathway)